MPWDSDFQRGMAIGGIAPMIAAWVLPLLRQVLVAAVVAIATAVGKELIAMYVKQQFKDRGRRKNND